MALIQHSIGKAGRYEFKANMVYTASSKTVKKTPKNFIEKKRRRQETNRLVVWCPLVPQRSECPAPKYNFKGEILYVDNRQHKQSEKSS